MSNASQCPSCGKVFPNREATGECNKCVKLAEHARDSPEYKDVMTWLQCALCALTFRNMAPTPNSTVQVCGSPACNRNPFSPTTGKENVPQIQQDRTNMMLARLKKTSATEGGPTGLATDTLLQREHGGGMPGERQIQLGTQMRVSKGNTTKINETMGWGAQGWAVSKFMSDIKAELLEDYNVKWTRKNNHRIRDEEVEWRFQGGQSLEANANTEVMTLDQFYTFYSAPSRRGNFLDNISKPWDKNSNVKAKRPFLPMELLFDHEAYERRVHRLEHGDEEPSTQITRKRGRAASTQSLMAPPKKARASSQFGGNAPVSMFGLGLHRGPISVTKESPIAFVKINVVTGALDGVTKLVEAGESYQGSITEAPFNKGRMKQAHELTLPSSKDTFVAKRFYRIEENSAAVEVGDNNDEIRAEATRQSHLAWFLDAFYRFVRSHVNTEEVSFYDKLAAAEVFIARETGVPSLASGMDRTLQLHDDEGIEWLVELRRAQAVTKFSGTSAHKQLKNDLLFSTVSAFAHFSFGFGNHKIVFADLQGTNAIVDGKMGVVLFDVMTHTEAGDSGVGDCGEEGIKLFTEQHECSPVCLGFGLDESYPMDLDAEDGAGAQKLLVNYNSDDDPPQ